MLQIVTYVTSELYDCLCFSRTHGRTHAPTHTRTNKLTRAHVLICGHMPAVLAAGAGWGLFLFFSTQSYVYIWTTACQNQQNDMCAQWRLRTGLVSPPRLIRVFVVCMKKHWVLSYRMSASEDWSDWMHARANQSLHRAHRSFCRFCHIVAHFFSLSHWNLCQRSSFWLWFLFQASGLLFSLQSYCEGRYWFPCCFQ